MDYHQIKETAKENGESVQDLLALSPGNDPFYVGSPGQMEKAKWFGTLYDMMGRPDQVHIRRVHYWLTTGGGIGTPKPDGNVYQNSVKDWSLMTMAAKYARYAGFVPIERVIDRRNPPAIVNSEYWDHESPEEMRKEMDANEIINTIVGRFWPYNPSKTQPYLMEIWCEKSTMNDILEPICEEYGMNLVTGLGELSITSVRLLIERIHEADKPTRVFYISDFDPAGEGMPVSVSRKIEFLIQDQHHEGDIKLMPIVLTPEQCVKYKLPRIPIKEEERRKAGFEERHGTGATELDALEALHPGELRKIIEGYIDQYFNRAGWETAILTNRVIRKKIREFLQGKIGNFLGDLSLKEFEDIELNMTKEVYDEDEPWLYDSNLGYTDQLRKYKEHKS